MKKREILKMPAVAVLALALFFVLPAQMEAQTWASVSTGDGGAHTVAIRTDGSLWAWGSNMIGQLGDGTTINRHRPVRIGLLWDGALVSAGTSHNVAVRRDGTLWAWGFNESGQLGDGTGGGGFERPQGTRHVPVRIGLASNWASVTASFSHTVAIRRDGSLWAWGSNSRGQLGDGSGYDSLSPVRIGP